MDRVYSAPDGAPIGQIIIELELAKTRAVHVQLAFEEARAAQELTRRVVPASGPLPPMAPKH